MSLDRRDVAAPPDALAWICATDRIPGYWTSQPDDIDAAHARGVRVLPTEPDEHGDRWLRNVTEPAHLADVISLADRVSLIDRLASHTANAGQDDAATGAATGAVSDEQQPISRTEDGTRGHSDDPRAASTAPSAQHAGQGEPRKPRPPDPEDILAAITNLFERGSRQYRAADTGMSDLHQLWDRLDGDDKQLLAGYEEHSNRAAEQWSNDRFRLGYALGASRILEWIG